MDNEKIKQLVLEMKCLGEVAEVNGMTVEGNPLHPLINDAWQTIAALSQPAAEGWKPSDEEVQAWNIRHDEPFQGRLDAARCAIDDARSMHMLAASTTPPQEQPEAVEPVAWMWRRHYSGGGFITGLKPTQEQARALCELFKDGGTYDEVKPLFDLSPTASQALRMAAESLCDLSARHLKNGDIELGNGVNQAANYVCSLIPPTSEQDSAAQGASESDQRKLGFAEGVKAVADFAVVSGYISVDGTAYKRMLALTPPADTVTMTREKFEAKLFEVAEAAALARGQLGARKVSNEIRAIVAQHMPEESK